MRDERRWQFRGSMRPGRRALCAFAALALAVLAADAAEAQRLRRASVVLEGYVGAAPAGTRAETRLVLSSGAARVDFDVTRVVASTGNRSQRQILHDARPHQNTLVLRGTQAVLTTLTSAAAGTQLRISGYHRTGTNTLQVSRVETMPASPPPTAPAP